MLHLPPILETQAIIFSSGHTCNQLELMNVNFLSDLKD